MDLVKLNDMLKGIFLLILAVSGNFVAETLGCKTQKLLSENMYAKHSIILLILYFTIGFTTSGKPSHPSEILLMSLNIYVLFLMFTKMDLRFTLMVFSMLCVAYINYTYITYYTTNNSEYKIEIEKHLEIQKMLYGFIILTILIGFVLYYRKQYKEYYKTWSTISFLFGVNKCKSLA